MNHLRKITLFLSVPAIVLGLIACSPDKGQPQLTDQQKQEINDRLAPVGEVRVEGRENSDAQVAAETKTENAVAARSGEQIYNTTCVACHASGAAGAPKIGVAAEWKDRIAKGKDTLYSHAMTGFNAMPPKGLCMDCTEEELHNAVDYIIGQSQ